MIPPAKPGLKKACVLVPVRDDAAGLRSTLASVRAARWEDEVEVIVCNDAGPPEISQIVAEHGFREVRLDEPGGSYAARNLGLRSTESHFVAFLDADEIVVRDWLSTGLSALEEADYVGGRIDVVPFDAGNFWQRVDARYAFPVDAYMRDLHFAPTANLFVRRRVFEQVGLFNETMLSGGDREFGQRVHRAGLRQRYCPDAILQHPARDLAQQLRKLRRVARGAYVLDLDAARGRWSVFFRSAARAARFGLRAAIRLPAALAVSDEAAMAAAKHALDAYFQLQVMGRAATALLRYRPRGSAPQGGPT